MSAAIPISPTPAAAVEYVKAGLVLVPFDTGMKGPNWKGWNLRENCISTVEKASELYVNIGLAHAYCEGGPTMCLDVDNRNDAHLFFLKHGLNLDKYWNDEATARYESGRAHRRKILYRLPPDIGVLPSRQYIANGFELRCASARGRTFQDVLPPSIHPKTGKPYCWLGPGDFRNIAQIPDELLSLWRDTLCTPREVAAANGEVQDSEPPTTTISHTALAELTQKIDPAKLSYMQWLNVGMALHHVTGGGQDGLGIWDNWSTRDGRRYKGLEDHEKRWEGFDCTLSVSCKLGTLERLAGATIDMSSEYEAVPDDPKPAQDVPTPAPHRLAFYPDAHFLDRPPLKWFIPRTLPACEIAMVYGASQSGKSFFVYDLVAKIAQGQDWRGRKTKKARVARIVAEGSAGDTNRVRAYASTNGGALPGLIECHARVDLMANKDYLEIREQIQLAGGADIVVVDTLTAAAPTADQNNQMDISVIVDHCQAIRSATGATILWIHHSGKDASKGSRGSSAIPAAVDVEIEVTESMNKRQAEVTKLRDGEKGEKFLFVLRQVLLGTDEDGEPITSCVVDHLPGESQRQRPVASRQPTGANQKIVWRAFQDLAGFVGETTVQELCAQSIKSLTVDDGKRDTRTQRAKRAIETLCAEEFLILDGGIVRCV